MHLSSINGKLCILNKTNIHSPILCIKSIKRDVEQSPSLKRFSVNRDTAIEFSRGDSMKHKINDTLYFTLTSC